MPSTHDLVQTTNDEASAVQCDNRDGCLGEIPYGGVLFVDAATQNRYCEGCGQRLRYHRKKASQRGEDHPITFADVAHRLG